MRVPALQTLADASQMFRAVFLTCLFVEAIESSNPTLLTEEENRLFIKYNALIPDEYNESCIYNHFYNKSRYGKKCLTATVLLTWSCNFRCIWRELIPKCQGIVGDF